MNELIEHLAEKATKEMDQDAFSEDMNIPTEWYHKFAELIVRECADYIDAFNKENMVEEGMDGAYMKKHFGVEE